VTEEEMEHRLTLMLRIKADFFSHSDTWTESVEVERDRRRNGTQINSDVADKGGFFLIPTLVTSQSK
jgi:hypothetical protein